MAMADATDPLFDTHAHVRALISAGMPEPQAEAIVRLQVDVLQRHIVTKADAAAIRSDIARLRTWSETQFANLRTSTEAEFAKVRTEIAGLRSWCETQFAALKTDVAALKTDVAALKADVAALKADVATLKTDVAIVPDAIEASAAKTTTRIVFWVSGINITIATLAVAALEIL